MNRLRAGSIAWLVVWATTLLVLGSGCAPTRPQVAPRSQLQLGASGAPSTRDQALTIGFTAPTGQASASSEPTIVFSKALRKVSEAAAPPPPVTLEPQVAEGRWEWVGSRSVRFVHAKPLPNATRFTVRVPAGITAVDGTALAEGVSWTFETPAPALARAFHGPATGNASLDVELPLPTSGERPPANLATDPIRLVFNQPVDLAALSASLRVSAKTKSGSAPVAFKLSAVPERPEEIVARLEQAPSGATLKLELGELVSKEGPLRGAAVSLEARTRGPLEVVGLFCRSLAKAGDDPAALSALVPATKATQCALEQPLELRLSNAVTQEALDAALQATPPLASAFAAGARPDGSFAIELYPGYETTSGKLRLRLSRGMADDRGGKLASSYQATATLASPVVRPKPEASFGLRGRYGKLAPDGEVLVFGQRVTDVSAYAVPLSLEDSLFRKSDAAPPPPAASKLVQSLPASPGDEPTAHKVQLAKLFETMPHQGDVAFVVRYKDADTKELAHSVHVVTLTNLAVFTRTSHGRARVWVLSAEGGAPVQGAKVVVRSDQATSPTVETDAKGRADVDIPAQGTDFRVVVSKGEDTIHHAISARGGQDLGGVLDLFVDRGVYRPGETVHIKGIARTIDDDGKLVAASGKVRAKVVDTDGARIVSTFEATLNEFGTFSTTHTIPPDAKLGWLKIEGEIPGEATRYGRTHFAVAEYHPLEFEVGASIAKATHTLGEETACTVSAKYLHGSPLAGAPVTVAWSLAGGSFEPPVSRSDAEHYSFDGAGPAPTWTAQDIGKLDAQGKATFKRTAQGGPLPRPGALTCSAVVRDVDNRELDASGSTTVHPGAHYVGIWAPHEVAGGATFTSELVAVTPAGEPVAVAVDLVATLVAPGEEPKALGKCSVVAGAAPSKCSFTAPPVKSTAPPEPPRIKLEARSVDSQGRVITSARNVWLVREQSKPPPPAPSPPEPEVPSLRIVRAVQLLPKVGETREIRVTSPWQKPALAMLSIERETVIEERQFTLDPAGTTLTLQITEAMAPEVVLRVVAVMGAERRETEEGLSVDPSTFSLHVGVAPTTPNTTPGAAVDVDVTVTDAAGKPARAEVTLWAVDEGSLAVTGYQLPYPEAVLIGTLGGHAVRSFSSHDQRLVVLGPLHGSHRSKAPTVRMGATSVTRAAPRSDFRQTVFFAGSLVTDDTGKLRHRFVLPDQLTTYRVMAVAVTKGDRFGAGQSAITANKPLMVRPSLPTAVRVGDELSIPVAVLAGEKLGAPVTLEISADGLEIVGDKIRELSLDTDAGANKVVFHAAARRAGDFAVTIRGASKGAADSVLLRGKIVAPTFIEEVAVQGEASAPAAEGLGDLSDARPDVGELTVRLSRSRLVGLERGLEQLLQYPFGCSEQTASRLLPLVTLGELSRALDADLGSAPDEMINDGVARLQGAQRSDGGFGLWSGSQTSDPWLSAWVLFVLQSASERGAAVPAGVLESATKFLNGRLAALMKPGAERTSAALRGAALAVDVLAMRGQDVSAAAAWLDGQALGAAERALLLHALAVTGGDPGMRKRLLDSLTKDAKLSGPAARIVATSSTDWVPTSGSLPSALTLRALVAHDAKHALIEPLARGLLLDGEGGAWPTTHETAWALLGLDAYRSTRPSDAGAAARVFFGDELVLEHTFSKGAGLQKQVAIPMAKLASGGAHEAMLTFDVDRGGIVYYDARLRFARKALPEQPVDQGIEVLRTLTVVSSQRPQGVIVEGDLVRVDVTLITHASRSAVVVEVPTPGGLYVPDSQRTSTWRNDAPAPFVRREVRDDRVVYFADTLPAGVHQLSFVVRARHEGTFVMPSAKAFEMYAPEVAGWTAVERVAIKPGS